MARFFIDRPIFAWVVALFIMVAGGLAITQLPIALYPAVAPPTVVVSASYPGASAQTLEDAVLSVMEREINGAQGLVYMESVAQASGNGTITVSFEPGTNIDMAQVDVQNRLSRAAPRLPAIVTQNGVRVDKARSNFLLMLVMSSTDPNANQQAMSDYVSRNILPEIQRMKGVGQAQMFGSERAMRIWLDPARLQAFNLSTTDVANALRDQNAQVSGGSLGDLPNVSGQGMTATVVVPGQISTVEQFGELILRSTTDGATVRLKDVARIELGLQAYNNLSRLNGKPAVGIGIQQSPSGNALETARLIKKRMDELSRYFPQGMQWTVPYDSTTFIDHSISKVVHTLLEALVLVFLVMFLFLQNLRYTIIPTIVVPVALLGTFAVMLAMGYSINVLTMFGMVLVIGIVVDDAIVVVENVERIMAHERLTPLQATYKAMAQISSAIIGVTVVLISVFVPLAFFSGSVGNIYRQFALVMGVSIAFSAFLALSLTPALCATMLRPVSGDHHDKKGFFGWFNRFFARSTRKYEGGVTRILPRSRRMMLVYAVLVAVVGVLYMRMPTGFLPQEDQGNLIVNVQLPPGATRERAQSVMEQIEGWMLQQPEVQNMVGVLGFSFGGQGQNAALSFVTLKNWDERPGPQHSSNALAGRAMQAFGQIRDASVFALNPPAIQELGSTTGFSFRLQDRGDNGHDALVAARNQLLGMARQSKVLTAVRPDGLEDAPQLQVDINREQAAAQGVSFASINAAISTAMGSQYVNDFPNAGRLQRVIVQADAPARGAPQDILSLTVVNSQGKAVPLSAFATTRWITGPMQTIRYNGYPSMRIAGNAAPGYSTGDAMKEMEALAARLPAGFGYEWSGQSREEKLAGSKATVLYAFAILSVFLCLAALYESWSIPFAVILVVPLGVLGVLLGTGLRAMANDVYFQVGLVTIIGLSAKNAILIIEFAKDLQAQGKSVMEAALAAVHLRFRPIIMTSMAFMLGVVPLYFASGAGSASQRAIGTSVMFGMLTGTFLAVFFVPVFFVLIRSIFKGSERERERFAAHAAHAGITPDAADDILADAEQGMTEEARHLMHQGAEALHPATPKNPDHG